MKPTFKNDEEKNSFIKEIIPICVRYKLNAAKLRVAIDIVARQDDKTRRLINELTDPHVQYDDYISGIS